MRPKPDSSAQFSTDYFRGSILQIVLGVTRKTVHARAVKEGWPWRKRFNWFEYRVSSEMEAICTEIADRLAKAEPKAPRVRLADLLVDVHLRQRTFARELIVRWSLGYQAANPNDAQFSIRDVTVFALRDVFRYALPKFRVSKRSVERWRAAYQRFGMAGIMEQKRGRVGRRAKPRSTEPS